MSFFFCLEMIPYFSLLFIFISEYFYFCSSADPVSVVSIQYLSMIYQIFKIAFL